MINKKVRFENTIRTCYLCAEVVKDFWRPLVDTSEVAPDNSAEGFYIYGLMLPANSASRVQGPSVGSAYRQQSINIMSGVILRANRGRDNKTFSDALARYV